MQTVFALFSLENAEAAALELQQRLGPEAVNLIAPESIRERLTGRKAQPAAPGGATLAPVAAPTLAHLMSRKRPVFVGESGSLYVVNELAAHILAMVQSAAPTKTQGSLRVALEEYGVATHYAEAYATGVAHGYVLVFAGVPETDILALSDRLEALGGREVFAFQRLD